MCSNPETRSLEFRDFCFEGIERRKGPPRATKSKEMVQLFRSTKERRKDAFSIVEMLLVIAVISVLLAFSPALFEGLLSSSGVSGGSEVAASAVALARGEARLAFDVDPNSPGFLKRMAIFREYESESGKREWGPVSEAKFLPPGVFLYRPLVGGEGTMLAKFSNAESPTEWIYHEFDSLGRLYAPISENRVRAQLVFISGHVDESGKRELVVSEGGKKGMTGFVLRKAGSVTFFPGTPTAP